MRRSTLSSFMALSAVGWLLSVRSSARGQSAPPPSPTSVPTVAVVDILTRSFTTEAALKSVHTDGSLNREAIKNDSIHLRVIGDCVNQPSAILAQFRVTGTAPFFLTNPLRHVKSEYVVHITKGPTVRIQARVRALRKRGTWKDTGPDYLPENTYLGGYISAVCPFLQANSLASQFASLVPDPDNPLTDYVHDRGETSIRGKWVRQISFNLQALFASPSEHGVDAGIDLSIDQRSLYWVRQHFYEQTPGFSSYDDSDYSRFNRPITIRLPKIGSSGP